MPTITNTRTPHYTGATRGNFDGPGLGHCRVADDCATLDREEEEQAKAEASDGRRWKRKAQGAFYICIYIDIGGCVVCVYMHCFDLIDGAMVSHLYIILKNTTTESDASISSRHQ